MDTSEQYIKMCEKAPKLLEVWNDGDLYAYGIDEPECPDRYTDVRMVHYCERDKPKSDAIRIYRQDQLQEMVISKLDDPYTWMNVDDLIDRFNEWYEEAGLDTKLTSMEQLWLAFVMFELHHKVWSNEEWIEGGK